MRVYLARDEGLGRRREVRLCRRREGGFTVCDEGLGGALALGFASQIVPPSETHWHSTYVFVEKRPFRSSTSTRHR